MKNFFCISVSQRSHLGEGGAPDAIGFHAAAEQLLLQATPFGLGGADLLLRGRPPGLPQLLALSGCSSGKALRRALFAQDAMLQAGAELAHGLAQPGHEQHRAEPGRAGLRGDGGQLGVDGGQDAADTGQAALTQGLLHGGRVGEAVE